MRIIVIIFSLLILSCSKRKNNKSLVNTSSETITVVKKEQDDKALSYEKNQDSLRALILNSKPNNILKTNIVLQELYIRGFVKQINDIVKFELPFDLHGLDCGAPDCYSTDITFEFVVIDSIEFPKKINFKLLEHGCGIKEEEFKHGVFELIEESDEYVNYYSKKENSNLVILGKRRKLYYFPKTKLNEIKIELIDEILEQYDEENEDSIIPYQSIKMVSNEYQNFIEEL